LAKLSNTDVLSPRAQIYARETSSMMHRNYVYTLTQGLIEGVPDNLSEEVAIRIVGMYTGAEVRWDWSFINFTKEYFAMTDDERTELYLEEGSQF